MKGSYWWLSLNLYIFGWNMFSSKLSLLLLLLWHLTSFIHSIISNFIQIEAQTPWYYFPISGMVGNADLFFPWFMFPIGTSNPPHRQPPLPEELSPTCTGMLALQIVWNEQTNHKGRMYLENKSLKLFVILCSRKLQLILSSNWE